VGAAQGNTDPYSTRADGNGNANLCCCGGGGICYADRSTDPDGRSPHIHDEADADRDRDGNGHGHADRPVDLRASTDGRAGRERDCHAGAYARFALDHPTVHSRGADTVATDAASAAGDSGAGDRM
jgi:hypothetical protein